MKYTKSKLYSIFKEIINDPKYKMNTPLHNCDPNVDYEYMTNLIVNYHHKDWDVAELINLKIKPNTHYKHNNLYMSYVDSIGEIHNDVMVSVSNDNWLKKDNDKRVKNALRHSLRDQHTLIRNALKETQEKCPICNEDINSIELHLDHCGNMEYRHIKELYVKDNPNLHEFIVEDYNGFGYILNDEKKQEWINFHNKLARYQLVCKTCNLKKNNTW